MADQSEFASLSDLAINKGVSHSEFISEIHDKILSEYKKLYSNEAQTVEVVVNEKTGEVSLMRDKKDVTPTQFLPIAERIAREVVIEKIKREENKSEVKTDNVIKEKKPDGIGKFIIAIIFWGYNLLYIFILFMFIANFSFNVSARKEIMNEILTIGIYRTTFLLIAATVPLISIISAVTFLRKRSDSLGTLLFLFEVPLVVISLILSITLTSPTPAMWFVSLMILFSIPVILLYVLDIQVKSAKLLSVIVFLRQSLFMFSLYISLLFSFVLPLIFGYIARNVFEFVSENFFVGSGYSYNSFNPAEIIIVVIFGGLYLLIILALASAPYLITFLLARIFFKGKRALEQLQGSDFTNRAVIVFASLWLILFAASAYQPNSDKYIEQLEKITNLESFEEREKIVKDLIPHESRVRRAFEDLKNVRKRYIMAKSDDYLKDAYKDVFNVSDFAAEMVHQTFVLAAYPFVYQGSLDRSSVALKNFEYVFGKTLSERYYPTQETKNVILMSRRINAVTDYDNKLATITVEEEYTTPNSRDQEIIYEFSLSQDSVVSGLKLGPSLEFDGVIAPKGAARETYERELRRTRDPALLEQTGPSQYRLRVFPVPGTSNFALLKGKNQKVQFKYITTLDDKGYALPSYSKEQNIKVDENAISYYINSGSAEINENHISNSQTKQAIEQICSRKELTKLRTDFASTAAYLVPNIANSMLNGKYKCDAGQIDLSQSLTGAKFALIIDVSYENKDSKLDDQIQSLFKSDPKLSNTNDIDLYKFNDLLSIPLKLTTSNESELSNLSYFGTSDWVNTLSKLKTDYDFAILLTNSQEALLRSSTVSKGFPIYIIHENVIPAYVTKVAGEIIQSGGFSFTDVRDAINTAVLVKLNASMDGKNPFSYGNQYSFFTDSSKNELMTAADWQNITIDRNDPAAVLLAQKYLIEIIRSQKGSLDNQISFIDQTNRFAENNSFVFLYSSFIALVNETQQQTLKNLSENFDRYKDTTSAPQINLQPGGQFAPLRSVTLNPFGGGSTSDFGSISNAPMTGIGTIGMSGGGGGSFTGLGRFSSLSLIILANGFILGSGIIILVFSKIHRRRKS